MGIIEGVRRHEDEQKRQATAEQTGESEGLTLKEILADKEHHDLLGRFLEQQGDMEIAEKLLKGDISENDIPTLDHYTRAFREKMMEAKPVIEYVQSPDLDRLVNSSKELQKLVGIVGQEGTRETLVRSLKKLAIEDPSKFQAISRELNNVRTIESRIADAEKRAQEYCAKYNVSTAEYERILKMSNAVDRDKALKEYLEKNTKGGWFGWGKDSKVQAALSDLNISTTEIDGILGALGRRELALANVLAAPITKNPEMFKTFVNELQGKKHDKEKLENMKEQQKQLRTPEEMKAEWEKHKDDEWEKFKEEQIKKLGLDWMDPASAPQREKIREDFYSSFMADKQPAGSGFFSRIVKILNEGGMGFAGGTPNKTELWRALP